VTLAPEDNALRSMLAEAELAPLVPAVAQLTGDYTLLREDLRPDPALVLEPEGGLTEDQLAEIRELLFGALSRWREAGSPPAPDPTDDELRRLMAYLITDDGLVAEYFSVLREELAIGGADLRAPDWHKDDIAPDTPFTVAIVGAGMSGLLAAHRLEQAGVPFVIFDKNADVGGTWFENSYPGCRVDVANHLYSYSFTQHEWPQHFSDRAALLDYFRQCADDYGLRPHIRFETEVLDATFEDETSTWQVRTQAADGTTETQTFQAVISAVGQLNRPHMPEIPGLDDFAGPAFHSARWDHGVDLHGKRVAVIGTGASGAQLIPVVAEQAGHLTIFQRTANWLFDTPEYHDDLPAGHRRLLDDVSSYQQWSRLWLFWRTHEGLLPAARVDPAWDGPPELSVSEGNEMVRQLLTEYLSTQFADHPELLDKVIPDYPPIAKRILRDNGIWVRTLTRDDVELVTEPIERITASGVVTADGVEHEVDVIVYGTGFHASKFLTPMRVTGRGGADLHERWDGDARAYLGVTVPDFPNLFCLYGPNTNIVINGSITYFSECGTDYILGCVRALLEGGHRTLDIRRDVHDAFNEQVDAENMQMAWGVSTVNSWYKNANGRVAQNWPFSLLEYWQRTRAPDPADYVWH
jgi:4-hydroxyacetophenone monooxygenase